MNPESRLASPRHTAILLAIIGVIALAGIRASRPAHAAPDPAPTSHVTLYLILIGAQLLWVRFVHAGLKRMGHSLTEFTGRWAGVGDVAWDVFFAALVLVAIDTAMWALKLALGDPPSNVGFLLPHGLTDSLLWIALSVTAGVCEELVFRGYLQRQLSALSGSAAAGVALQALVFGVAHGYQGLPSIAKTATYGLGLGLLAWWRGNIRSGIIAHAATDVISGLALFQR
jgi:membrane protease YdiL (CAAX protease family)